MKQKDEQIEKQDPKQAIASALREIESIKEQKTQFENQKQIFESKRQALVDINELRRANPGLVRPSYVYEQHPEYWGMLDRLKQADHEYNLIALGEEIRKIERFIEACDIQIKSQEDSVAKLQRLVE